MTLYRVVGANIDTWLINVKGKLPDRLAEELDFLKEASQEADEDIPTRWSFAGETLFIRAHGSGRQWRWILHCPSLHLDIGRGKLNHIIGKARSPTSPLWEAVQQADFFGDGVPAVRERKRVGDLRLWDRASEAVSAGRCGNQRRRHSDSCYTPRARPLPLVPPARPALRQGAQRDH
jgi:hypothetical protein